MREVLGSGGDDVSLLELPLVRHGQARRAPLQTRALCARLLCVCMWREGVIM